MYKTNLLIKGKKMVAKSIKPATGIVSALALVLFSNYAMAQGIGTALDDARTQISGIQGNVGTLILALGGVIGLIGAIRVFIKWNNGDQDVQKALIGWGGACIFLLLSGGLVSSFFG